MAVFSAVTHSKLMLSLARNDEGRKARGMPQSSGMDERREVLHRRLTRERAGLCQ